MKHIEKRLNRRYDCEASAVCSYFNTNRAFDAHILNFSENGLYLESRESLKPGTTLLIVLKKCENGFYANKSTCLRSVSLAEVKWCHTIVSESEYSYGAGLKQYPSDA